MHIHAIFIFCLRVLIIVSEPEGTGHLIARLRIEISIRTAGISSGVANSKIDEIVGIIDADWNVARDVSHIIVHAEVPSQRKHGQEVAKPSDVTVYAPREGKVLRTRYAIQCRTDAREAAAIRDSHCDHRLAA